MDVPNFDEVYLPQIQVKGNKKTLFLLWLLRCKDGPEAEAALPLLCFGLRAAATKVVSIFEIEACGKSHIICFFTNDT